MQPWQDCLPQHSRWGAAPDLVLSGPNEGHNVGHIVISSGTVGNVQFSATRGIPSIALSAGSNTVDNSGLANPNSQAVAELTLKLVRELKRNAKKHRAPLLPEGVVLNVNFPNSVSADTEFVPSRIGTFDLYNLKFVTSPYIGLGAAINNPSTATGGQQKDESVVISNGKIAVTPMQIGYDGHMLEQRLLENALRSLFKDEQGHDRH